jgi:hypothetical protein
MRLVVVAALIAGVLVPFGVRGNGAPEFVTTLLPIDPGVVVALVTCASFAWFAAVLARECAVTDGVPLA